VIGVRRGEKLPGIAWARRCWPTARRQGRLSCRRNRRDRLLPAGYHGRGHPLRGIPRARLPMVPRRPSLRSAPLPHRPAPTPISAYGSAVGAVPPSRSPMRRCTAGRVTPALGMKGAREARAYPGPHRPRAQGARLARPLPRSLGEGRTHD
jgi:hypothetical protein